MRRSASRAVCCCGIIHHSSFSLRHHTYARRTTWRCQACRLLYGARRSYPARHKGWAAFGCCGASRPFAGLGRPAGQARGTQRAKLIGLRWVLKGQPDAAGTAYLALKPMPYSSPPPLSMQHHKTCLSPADSIRDNQKGKFR